MDIVRSTSSQGSYLELVRKIPKRRRTSIRYHKLTEDMAKKFEVQISRLNSRPGDILIQFSSPGGGNQAGKHLFDILRISQERTVGLVLVSANSAAFTALQGCHLRLASENSTLVVHNPELERYERIKYSSRVEDFIPAFEERLLMIQEQREWLIGMTLQKSKGKITREELEILLDEGRTISAQEALKLGFIDGIV